MTYETIRLERDGAVATLVLNRPEKMNALNDTVRSELTRAVEGLAGDDEVGVLIVRGEGERAFAAGADVTEFAQREPHEQRAAMADRQVYDIVAGFPKPVIAAIHGYCLGGGCELALACDLRVADTSARFGQPEVKIGLIPGGGGTQRLARLVGPGQAMRMILTGDFIDAEEAHRIGLVEFLVDEDEHLEKAREVAGRITSRSPVAVGLAKRAVRAAMDTPLSRGLELERELFLAAFASHEGQEGVQAFVEERDPEFEGR